MSDVEPLDYAELHARALRLAGKAIAQVSVGDFENPTPCTDWNLKVLLNHVVAENFWVRPMVEGKSIEQVGDEFTGDLIGNEPIPMFEKSAADAADTFYAAGAMRAPCAVSYGPISGEIYCGHRTVDLVLHGWDVAQSVGADYVIPADMIDALRVISEPGIADARAAGVYGAELPAADDADEQTQLLAWFGRAATK